MNKWRLPTIQELKNIVDYTKHNPATNLENIKPDRYWSSSPRVSGSSSAWAVYFSYGDDYYYSKGSSYYVRCVRTLDDGSLEWSKEDAPNKMKWQEAMEYAESLNTEPKKIIVLETWLIKSLRGEFYSVEGTYAYLNFMFGNDKIKLLSTREIEI